LTILSVPVPKITIKDCYILKMVIQGYFMSIDRLLFEMLKTEIIKSGLKIKEDVEPILYM
jgi:hypothetical protein